MQTSVEALPSQTVTVESPEDQLDLFVADLVDVTTKGEMSSMEYPIFAISTRPDKEIYRFDNPATKGWIEIIPSAKGRATIFDKDLLLYAISQIVEAQNRGLPVSRKVRITAYDYLKATRRNTDGRSYQILQESLVRLRGTTFKSNITVEGKVGKTQKGYIFGFIDDAMIQETNGRMSSIEITLSERLAQAVYKRQVLTYDKRYFDLRSPISRRLYELCRKYCGNQPIWEISITKLYNKFGTRSSVREFRRKIKNAVAEQGIPGYLLDHEKACPKMNAQEKLIVVKRTPEDKLPALS